VLKKLWSAPYFGLSMAKLHLLSKQKCQLSFSQQTSTCVNYFFLELINGFRKLHHGSYFKLIIYFTIKTMDEREKARPSNFTARYLSESYFYLSVVQNLNETYLEIFFCCFVLVVGNQSSIF
jgi:hypothetical protein